MQWKPLEDEFDIIAVLCWVTLPCARILRKKYDTCFHRYGILWRQISRRFRHVSPSLHLWAVSCTNSHPELDPISGLPRSTHRSRRTSLSSWTNFPKSHLPRFQLQYLLHLLQFYQLAPGLWRWLGRLCWYSFWASALHQGFGHRIKPSALCMEESLELPQTPKWWGPEESEPIPIANTHPSIKPSISRGPRIS